MRKISGFTLAEVLITLGIIGVVAAMTMPTLINSTQGAQYKAAYKKALSALSQAVTLNVALDEWNFADLSSDDTYSLQTMLNSRMNVVRTETDAFDDAKGDSYAIKVNSSLQGGGVTSVAAPGSDNVTLFFNDGIMFTFPNDVKECTLGTDETGLTTAKRGTLATNGCMGFIDVNGIKAPNRLIQCDAGATDNDCEIKSPTDVYPVIFYDQTIMPNSVAARAVLYSK